MIKTLTKITLDDACSAHASSDTHGDQSITHFTPFHLGKEGCRQLGPGAPQGMTQCNSAPVDIDNVRVKADLLNHTQGLNRKGFVEFDKAYVFQLQFSQLESFGNGMSCGETS